MPTLREILILILTSCLLYGCPEPQEDTSGYTPVLMDRTQLEHAIRLEGPTDIIHPGKIYYKNKYIFIGEKYEGIHIIDNTDSLHPRKIHFIRIPGCVDIAIKNNILYADNAVDLVSLDISSPENFTVTSRIKNALPEMLPPDLKTLPFIYQPENRPADLIIVGWKKNVK